MVSAWPLIAAPHRGASVHAWTSAPASSNALTVSVSPSHAAVHSALSTHRAMSLSVMPEPLHLLALAILNGFSKDSIKTACRREGLLPAGRDCPPRRSLWRSRAGSVTPAEVRGVRPYRQSRARRHAVLIESLENPFRIAKASK